MWLLPALAALSSAAARTFYRLAVAGERVPQSGPLLLVANHPNALLDPVLVAAAAGRPVRFLAKAPLVHDRRIGWLVRALGCIPVYRQQDDPGATGRNVEAFQAAYEALAGGSAVAIFPEGISHDAPALSPLKTGAARIALGAAAATGSPFPLMPVGLVLRAKETFRSEALAVVGAPVVWDDLAAAGVDDAEAVRQLTARIEGALREVTVNLEHWTDAPIVECAEAIWAVERGAKADPAERVERLRVASTLLAELRRVPGAAGASLVTAVKRHARVLGRLGLTPADLHADLRSEAAFAWSVRRIPLVLLPVVLVAIVGFVVWWPPYRLTGWAAGLADRGPGKDARATYKLIGGVLFYLAWLLLVFGLALALWGIATAVGLLVGMPLVGIAGLSVRERWRSAWADARRFLMLRHEPRLLADLRWRQRELAERLDTILAASRRDVPRT